MYDKEIIQLLDKLDEEEKKEILDFAEFINSKHNNKSSKQILNRKNPLLQIAGFIELPEMNSRNIDEELYK